MVESGIDTIEFYTPFPLSDMAAVLDCEPIERNGNYYGKILNHNVKIGLNGLLFFGSFQKAIDGQNISFADTAAQLNRLSELTNLLGEQLAFSKVQRADYAATMQMQYNPKIYFELLAELPRYTRRQTTDKNPTLYFEKLLKHGGWNSQAVFYNKGIESGHGGNLLRYEMRTKYGDKKPLLYELIEGADTLKKDAYELYTNIKKIQPMAQNVITSKDALNAIFAAAIRAAEQTNPNFLSDQIGRYLAVLPKREKSRLKPLIDKRLQFGDRDIMPLIDEIDTAVLETFYGKELTADYTMANGL